MKTNRNWEISNSQEMILNNGNQIQEPLISVITAVYNGAKTLQKTIDSVSSQAYRNFEYIVVDGGSTDNTLDIIKHNDHLITRWVSEPDEGIYDAFNKGIEMAKGDIIGIINSDDWYEPEAFELVKEAYLANAQADIYYGMARFWDLNVQLIAVQGYTDRYLEYGMISHPTCFVKKGAYETVARFDTQYRIAADYNLMLTLQGAGCKFHFIEKVLANFCEGGISTTNAFNIKNEVLKIRFNHGLISKRKYRIGKLQLLIRKKLRML